MSTELREMINFHLTGRRGPDAAWEWQPEAIPALMAPYRDLVSLRYDYPLILTAGPEAQAFVDTLSGIINRLLRDIAPEGSAGAQLRQHVLQLEQRMRELAAEGGESMLLELWTRAEKSLLAECESAEAEWLGNSIATARFALRSDGRVLDCDAQSPARLFRHAWQQAVLGNRALDEKIALLIIKLRDILKVDELKEGTARTPQKLKATLGKRYKESFDFERMADVLDDSTPHNRLPMARKGRIREALSVLESQRFFAKPGDTDRGDFAFDSLSAALKAYNERLGEVADVVKAIAIAELELENTYREDKHDSYFQRFGPQALTPEDIAQFPSYLVCLHESECNTRDLARLMEIVTCDMPIKVLVQVNDPLGEPSPVDGMPHQGSFAQQLVHTFVAGEAFVLQSPASSLYQMRNQLQRGLRYPGPAIFSVFIPFDDGASSLSPYLVSAAAHESRVFPAFSYDPSAGDGLADHFDIGQNPDVEADWPVRALRYEDEELQTVAEDAAFTLVDFAVTDPRYSGHFAPASKESWADDLVDVTTYMASETRAVEAVPAIAVVDSDDVLQRLAVDDKLIRIAKRCRERWHALQELGGIHSSYAKLAEGEKVPAEELPAAAEEPAEPVVEAVDAEPGESIDEPFIETPRCTTCDECTNRNDRMFAYDENKQAYIKDPDAGTYRELVEAAEICQVAIIHPGMPRNGDEPGLEELIKRAEPFNN
jgi:hypothetical protein